MMTKRQANDQRKRNRIIAWALVVAWAALIFFMSAHTGNDLDNGNELVAVLKRWLSGLAASAFGHEVDVSPVGHFCEYFVFGVLLTCAARTSLSASAPPRRAATVALLIAAAYAASDEFHQLFVPGRSCDPADWAVDMAAVIVSSLLAAAVMCARAQRSGTRTPQP